MNADPLVQVIFFPFTIQIGPFLVGIVFEVGDVRRFGPSELVQRVELALKLAHREEGSDRVRGVKANLGVRKQ